MHERILLYFSCPRHYNVSNGPRPSFIPNSYNTSPMLSFFALIKTFSECWSTLIVMIYDIFASQKHIFAIYARTKERFMSLLRAFLVINYTAKSEKENRVDSTVRVRHKLNMVTSKYSQKLHEKCIDLSCSYGETETILGKDNRKYLLNTIFKQV